MLGLNKKPLGIRSVFWGHATLEDKMELRRLQDDSALVQWSDGESRELVYNPVRIINEITVIKKPKVAWSQRNMADYYEWARKPRFTRFWDKSLFYCEKLRNDYSALAVSQLFLRQRFMLLGPDLSAAHFLLYRNCRVRFKGHDHWTEMVDGTVDEIPSSYEPGWFVEAIDASDTRMVYEGLQNMRNLTFLKYLDLSYCPYVDVWCIDRITGEMCDSLEFLNLSGCPDVNWNAIESLWRLRKLKTLVLYDMDHVKDLKLLCLLLLEVLPDLEIRGVDYIDTKLLEGTEHEHLVTELDELQLLADRDKEKKLFIESGSNKEQPNDDRLRSARA